MPNNRAGVDAGWRVPPALGHVQPGTAEPNRYGSTTLTYALTGTRVFTDRSIEPDTGEVPMPANGLLGKAHYFGGFGMR
jgi:hypothetical protein